MLKFICYPKCTTCQKAKKWLDDNGIQYELRDIKLDNPTFEAVLSASTYTVSPTSYVNKEKQIWHTHKMLVNTREYY